MPDSAAFEQASQTLERETDLDRLEARGTIRILLKQSGLDAKRVSSRELRVVVTQLLARELEGRGIASPEPVLAQIDAELARVPEETSEESPEDVFARLGGPSS